MSMKLMVLALLAFSMLGCGQLEGKPKIRSRPPSPVFLSKASLDSAVRFSADGKGKWVQGCQAANEVASSGIVGSDTSVLSKEGSSSQEVWIFDSSLKGERHVVSYSGNATCNGTSSSEEIKSFKYELVAPAPAVKDNESVTNFGVKVTYDTATDKDQISQIFDVVVAGDIMSVKIRSTTTKNKEKENTVSPDPIDKGISLKRDRSVVGRSSRSASSTPK